MKIVIIGAGASGLIAGYYLQKNNEVILLEKNSKVGKKLLITGNGKCNYFNSDMNISNYNSNNIELLNQIINEKNINEIKEFFKKLGIIPYIKNGYYYPYSNQAISIQNAILRNIDNVDIKYNTEVLDIEYDEKFKIKTNNGLYKADKVILAMGSKAYPKTGSDGLVYEIAKKFGHNIIDVKPALVGLKGNKNYYKDWTGIRTEVEIKYNNIKEQGEIQLTDYGVSGICIYNLSSKILRNNNKKIYINFIPFLNLKNKEEFKKFLNERKNIKHTKTSELFDGFLNYKLVGVILKISNIRDDNLNLDEKQIVNLYNNLTNFEFEMTSSLGFDNAQTCSGGIPLNEINLNTMESLKQKNLYIIGEALDVDGRCGGYNLGFSFMTGYIVGNNVKN